jgi:AraC-like DNA-binding protein
MNNLGMLCMNADRVFYLGLLGCPHERVLGALTLYASRSGELELLVEGQVTQRGELLIVPPYLAHRVRAEDKLIFCLLIEPEYLDQSRLPAHLQPNGPRLAQAAVVSRMREAQQQLATTMLNKPLSNQAFDLLLLGAELPGRTLQPRLEAVLELLRGEPTASLSAAHCAALCQLSPSRFMHLFSATVGSSFRHLRSWKRARNLLPLVQSPQSLTDIALELGYADASYFSNSIRQITGLRPKDIIAGSKRLKLLHSVQ